MSGLWVDIAFWVFAVAAVWFGWRVFVTDSMVRASFALLVSFLNVGAIMLLLLGEYLGLILFFMMAVEMMVMAIFMVMFMMNPAGLNPMMMVHQDRLSKIAGVVSFLALGAVGVFARFPAPIPDPANPAPDPVTELGFELLGGSMLVFESIGATLLATMIAAVVLSANRGRFEGAADAGSLPPPIDPDDPTSIPGLDADAGGGMHHGHDMGGHDMAGDDMSGDEMEGGA